MSCGPPSFLTHRSSPSGLPKPAQVNHFWVSHQHQLIAHKDIRIIAESSPSPEFFARLCILLSDIIGTAIAGVRCVRSCSLRICCPDFLPCAKLTRFTRACVCACVGVCGCARGVCCMAHPTLAVAATSLTHSGFLSLPTTHTFHRNTKSCLPKLLSIGALTQS
jgi:hypothetical protein